VCLASEWADTYFPRLFRFLDEVGIDFIGVDGPYHGDVCASTKHAHHRGLEDSQWAQWERMTQYFRECLRQGRETTAPDWYFLNGSQSTGMGYREPADKLPSALRLLLFRQYIYDGTWDKTPPMGWIGLPIQPQRTNDPRAGLEPLHEHLDEYERYLAQSFASGAAVRISGARLYDADETKAMVKKWVAWRERYRDILASDIIHVRRPDGRDIDCILHVNPALETKALAMVFNPTDAPVHRALQLRLYYTGLRESAKVRIENGRPKTYQLDSNAEIEVPVELRPEGFTWLTVQ